MQQRQLIWMGTTALMLGGLALGVAWARQQVQWPEVKERIRQEFPEVRQLTVAELARWLEAGDHPDGDYSDGERPAPVIFDVRKAEEYAVSHLPGAQHLEPSLERR